MALLLPVTILDPYVWERSSVTPLALNELVTAGQLAANEEGRPAEWIVPPVGDRAPNPPEGYVVSFIRFHERGFNVPASRFMRALCHYYGVELHNFVRGCLRGVSGDPSQLGALGTPLPRGALHVAHDGAEDPPRGARRRDVARPAGAVQGPLHPLHHDDEQRRLGAGMVLSAQRRARSSPYTGRVFKEKPSSWGYGVSTPQHRRRQDSVLAALRSLSEQGLSAMGVLAFLHHRRVVPLMERPLYIRTGPRGTSRCSHRPAGEHDSWLYFSSWCCSAS
jgi:hypothetical protein